MDSFGSNWATANESSGISVRGELSISPDPGTSTEAQPKGRRCERVHVEMGAALRQRGASGVSVQIMDPSTDGFRAATHLDLYEGTDVWLRLGGLEPCHARVVWKSGHYVGCVFARPLHPAVLDMIVAGARK